MEVMGHDHPAPIADLDVEDLAVVLEHVWMLLCSVLLMILQIGFAVIETGCVQERNVISTLMKHLLVLMVGAVAWLLLGSAIAFHRPALEVNVGDGEQATTLLGLLLCLTTVTIALRGVAERSRIGAHVAMAVIVPIVLYPLVLRWTQPGGWLLELDPPFHSGASRGEPHLVGGVAAAVGARLAGPRRERSKEQDHESQHLSERRPRRRSRSRPQDGPQYRAPPVVLGTLVIWVGWYGFAGANPGGMRTREQALLAARMAVNMTLGAVSGGLVALFLRMAALKLHWRRQIRIVSVGEVMRGPPAKSTPSSLDFVVCCFGAIAGLVAVSSGSDCLDNGTSMLVGALGSLAGYLGAKACKAFHIDDPMEAGSVHGIAGAVGVLCVGIFDRHEGLLFSGDWGLLWSQFLGVLTIGTFTLATSFVIFAALRCMGVLGFPKHRHRQELTLEAIQELVSILDRSSLSITDTLDALSKLKRVVHRPFSPQAGNHKIQGEVLQEAAGMGVPAEGEPAAKQAKTEPSGKADVKPEAANGQTDVKEKKEKKEEKKDKKEKKEKDGKEGKEKVKDKEKKDKKEKDKDKDKKDKVKDKGEKRNKEGEIKEKKDKAEKGDKVPGGKPEKKEKKDKTGKEKKDKKDKKDKKAGKLARPMAGKLMKASAAARKKAGGAAPEREVKVLMKSEEDYEPVNRWWEREDGALSGKRGAKKWDTFEHHGLMYAPEYEPHGIPIKYDGKPVKLDPEAEEVATYWTSVKGSDYETKEIFIKNFWKAFQAVLPKDTVIKDFSKCNFDDIATWREEERQKRLNRTKEEKEVLKRKSDQEAAWFTHALINGVRERLGAFKLEPPQLFRGRGEHPKQGLLKKRTFPEAIVINIAEDSCVPKIVGMPGHAYKDVVHENTVQWIASFEDGLLGETKYVSFAATSGLKGQPDMLKYDRARRLLHCINKVRESYVKLLTSKNLQERQKATATYFIDKLALRVGGEKNTEEEADTVGCCSLRVEHLTLEPPNTINFDFLGKDSIRYQNSVQVTEQVFQNIEAFMKNKTPEQDVFDKVKPSDLNDYFKEFMEDLTAKVFRTYNASFTLQQELEKFDVSKKSSLTQEDLVKFYNNANRQVAILCNHQKAESKQHSLSMQKMEDARATMEKNIRILKKHCVALQAGKADKTGQSKLPKDLVSCKKKIAETKLRLDKHVTAMTMKEDNKTVSLGTSKVNYMDPRITVAWCKKVDLAIEKVFPRTVRTKFPWAMHFKSSYMFD